MNSQRVSLTTRRNALTHWISAIIHDLDNSPTRAFIQLIKSFHIFFVQDEPIHVRVDLDTLGIIAFRQRTPTLLKAVANQNLVGRGLVLRR